MSLKNIIRNVPEFRIFLQRTVLEDVHLIMHLKIYYQMTDISYNFAKSSQFHLVNFFFQIFLQKLATYNKNHCILLI